MARIFHDGFELGRPARTNASGQYINSLWLNVHGSWHGSQGSMGVEPGGKSGEYRLQGHTVGAVNRIYSMRRDLGANLIEHYGRAEFRVESGATATTMVIFFLDDAEADVCHIRVTNISGLLTIHLYRQSTEIASLAAAFSTGTWVRLEWHLVIDDVSGIFELKRNGDEILSFSGDTKGTSSGNGVRWFCLGRNYATSNDSEIWYDDVAINDTTGTANNAWPGPGSILLLKPKGAGNYTQWTPDSGNNFARVNEIPETGDTAYVESDTADQIDTYEMQELAADLGVDVLAEGFEIKAVQHVMIGRWEEGETELARVLRLGAADHAGTPIEISNAYYRYWDEMFNVNPFDSQPWEVADLNNLEAGIKHITWSGP